MVDHSKQGIEKQMKKEGIHLDFFNACTEYLGQGYGGGNKYRNNLSGFEKAYASDPEKFDDPN